MYIIVELQTNNGTTANIVTAFEDKLAAESAYHTVLAAAAISQVEIHAAVMMDEYGNQLNRAIYLHQNEQETE